VALLLVAAFVIIDTLGQTVYTVLARSGDGVWPWLTALYGGLAALVAGARRLAKLFGGQVNGERLGGFTGALFLAAGLVVATIALTTVNVVSHAIAWDFTLPQDAPKGLVSPTPVADLPAGVRALERLADTIGRSCLSSDQQTGCPDIEATTARAPANGAALPGASERDLHPTIATLMAALILSVLFGMARVFVNNSSHHALYAARLTRAYLGASNPARAGNGAKLTNVHPDDDICPQDYWKRENFAKVGMPLHLINVTINETRDERTNTENQDRKGVGMALGPAGISVAAHHHAQFDWKKEVSEYAAKVTITPQPSEGTFSVFATEQKKTEFKGESLSLGSWTAISGAAFTTGLGYRTNLGLSLLAGMGNVRLGYWWDSGVTEMYKRGGSDCERARMRLASVPLFGVQRALLAEFLARFRGTHRRYWHVTDGGHFENLGAYELIRRRVKVIVIIDAEQDPDYEFPSLANLVRKARIDFQAEIEFLDEQDFEQKPSEPVSETSGTGQRPSKPGQESEREKRLGKETPRDFGPLKHLRRGRWQDEPFKEPSHRLGERVRQILLHPPERGQYARAHAAIGFIRYDGKTDQESVLLYLKPTLTWDEPADLVEYHLKHPDFPQEPTADQFFDEAQWESYRKLGEHIALKIFGSDEVEDGRRDLLTRLLESVDS